MTPKLTESDTASATSPCLSHTSTCTLAVTALVNKAAGTTALSGVLLIKVVANDVLLPLADHTASLNLWGALVNVNFDPVMVSVRSGPPATALVGEIATFTPGGGEDPGGDPGGDPGVRCWPPPQPICVVSTRIKNEMPSMRNIENPLFVIQQRIEKTFTLGSLVSECVRAASS